MTRRRFPLVDMLIGVPSTGPRLGAPALMPHGTILEIFTDAGCTTPADIRDVDGGAIDSVVVNGVTIPTFEGPNDGTTSLYAKPVDATLDQAFPIYTADVVAAAIDAAFAGGYASAFDDLLPVDLFYDNFSRSDRDLDGDTSPSGHVWEMQNPDTFAIVDGVGRFTVTPGQTSIGMAALSRKVHAASQTFRFTDDLQNQNAVLGCCSVSFGDASFQLAHYASPSSDLTFGSGLMWTAFLVFDLPHTDDPDDDDSAEYILLGSNITDGELLSTPVLDVDYTEAWRFLTDDTVRCTLIDGTTRDFTHARLPEARGGRVGTQKREGSDDTAGDIDLISVTASSAPATPQPFPGSGMVLDGTPQNWMQTQPPAATSDDLDVTFSLDEWVPASGLGERIFSRFGIVGNRSRFGSRTGTGSIQLTMYQGGVATSASTGTTVMPPTKRIGRMTRVSATGTVTIYAAADDEVRKLPLSDPRWSVVKTLTAVDDGLPVGPLDTSTEPLRLAHPTGSADPWLAATFRYFAERDGIDGEILAERDFIDPENLAGETDVAGNRWQHPGDRWRWAPVTVVVPAAAAAVVTDYDPGANIEVVLDADMKYLEYDLQGGGGAGGSGRRGLDGTDRFAGGPGAAGGHTRGTLDVQALRALGFTSLFLDVGDGGDGGAGVTVDNTDGNPGTAGVATRIKTSTAPATSANTIASAAGGNGGSGGTNAAGAPGGASTGEFPGGAGRAASTAVAAAPATSPSAPCGGGAGGTITNTDAVRAGGPGGPAPGWLNSAAAAGGAAGVSGDDGVTPTFGPIYGTSGAGGGASRVANAGRGGHGGRGAGGGSGGASKNGFTSGPGGNGGDGRARLVAYY